MAETKINFELNEKMKPEDLQIYRSSIDELDNLSNKKVYLLKDDRTEFKAFKAGFKEDIKGVFLIVMDDDKFKIKIKGNLSLDFKEKQFKFYPIFINRFGKIDENSKYWYKLDLSKVNDDSLGRFDKYDVNETTYDKIVREFKTENYTPPIAAAEWKSFIEPYEYYVELKFQLLKQDFITFNGFDFNRTKVILVDNKHKNYNNYLENELFIENFENNKKMFLLLDFDKHSYSFDGDYLKQNTFFIAKKTKYLSKEDKDKANEFMNNMNFKLDRNSEKSTFFMTDQIYTSDDMKGDGTFSKTDIELVVEQAYVTELIEEYSNINLRASEINKIFLGIKKPEEYNENSNVSNFENSLNWISNLEKDSKEIYKIITSVKKEINQKIKSVEDEDLSIANDLIYEIDSFDIDIDFNGAYEKANLIIQNLNERVDNNKQYYSSIKQQIELDEKSLLEEINDKYLQLEEQRKEAFLSTVVYATTDNKDSEKKNNQIQNDANKKLKEISKEIFDEKNNELKIIKQQSTEKISGIDIEFKNELKNIILEESEKMNTFVNRSLLNHFEIVKMNVESIYKKLDQNTIRTVEYIQEINIVYDTKDKNKKSLPNFYMVNTGDMVLVDTIRRIIQKIKRGEELNSDILYKIIRRTKLRVFNDLIDEKDLEFIPEQYEMLNETQKKAFRLAIDKTDNVAIIQGPPGTGKTEVITNIVKYFRNKGDKVLISSQTNVAIKNVLDKLCSLDKIENSIVIPWLTRNSKENYINENLSSTWHKKVISNIENSDSQLIGRWNAKRAQLKEDDYILRDFSLIRDAKAYAATTTTSVTLPKRGYDEHLEDVKVLIIDEVSKSILPEILRYALDVEKVILVGDYKQLNPIFDIRRNDFDIEIDDIKFEELRREIQSGIFYNLAQDAKAVNRIATLGVNYRSVPGVLDAYNVFYDEGGNEQGLIGQRGFEEYSNSYKFNNSEYFDSNHSLYFFDVRKSNEGKRGTSRYNKGELKVILKALHELANTLENAHEKDIAIIFPYAAQISMFGNEMKKPNNKAMRNKFKDLKWDTVDSFQGSEANIVFISTVITDLNSNNFLQDFRRVNVSMSRAKDMLIIVGKGHTLKQLEVSGEGIKSDKYFKRILDGKENKYLKEIIIEEAGE